MGICSLALYPIGQSRTCICTWGVQRPVKEERHAWLPHLGQAGVPARPC